MPRKTAKLQQFVVLPTRGLRATASTSAAALAPFLMELNSARTATAARSFVAAADVKMKSDFKVLDSIHEDGAKLVEMSAATAQDLRGLRWFLDSDGEVGRRFGMVWADGNEEFPAWVLLDPSLRTLGVVSLANAQMVFDILYSPPVHPIGQTHRKGKNNATTAEPGDPGSPWAIGGKEGGHKAIHPDLGNLDDFRQLVGEAKRLGIDIALDIAYQCTPDHPYVTEHPEWFRHRPDGTVQYAENPPKKYEDIYPFEFDSPHWKSLWEELKSIIEFWMDQGVHVFRVDNPHTKPFDFWEWMIRDLKKKNPEVILLAEAFTRPNIMYRLAKLGFTQSYTYFTWRNSKQELTDYVTELTQTEVREFFRPNFWPNTPDILHEYLQVGGRPAFITRLVLAATLSSNYGIYGPAYELCENVPREPGSEEYLNSEKYEIKHRNLYDPASLRSLISRVNAIRKENPALQSNDQLQFHTVDNDKLICYSKRTADKRNVIVTVVNLDPQWSQSGFVKLTVDELGIDVRHPYRMVDLLTGATFVWQGPTNYVELRPYELPAHILRRE